MRTDNGGFVLFDVQPEIQHNVAMADFLAQVALCCYQAGFGDALASVAKGEPVDGLRNIAAAFDVVYGIGEDDGRLDFKIVNSALAGFIPDVSPPVST